MMNGGRRQEQIYQDKEDYRLFLKLLQDIARMWNLRVSAKFKVSQKQTCPPCCLRNDFMYFPDQKGWECMRKVGSKIKKISSYLFIGLSLIILSGCASNTIVLKTSESGNQKTIFKSLDVSSLHVIFSQQNGNIKYENIQSTPFAESKIKEIYEANKKVLENDSENGKLYDCVSIDNNGKTSQCYKEYYNSIFSKRAAKVLENPLELLGVINLPITLLLDTMSGTTKNTQQVFTKADIDEGALQQYGKYMTTIISSDYDNSKDSFVKYRKFLQDTTLINVANENMIRQLRSFRSKEAYDLAYDMSLENGDLKNAYTSVKEIDAFLANPYQLALKLGGASNCFTVKSSSLNIRDKPSTRRSRVVGRYLQNDIVCVIQEEKDWVKSDKGWVSKKFLNLTAQTNEKNLFTKISRLKNLKCSYERQNALQTNSIAGYRNYRKTYGSDKNLDKRLQSLYRVEGQKTKSADRFRKAYEISPNEEDLTQFMKYSDLQEIRQEFTNPSFVYENHNHLLKAEFIERLRSLQTREGFSEAYQYSHDTKDLSQVLDRTTTISGLESFISKYKDQKNIGSAKKKLAPLYREMDTFAGYLSAYKLLLKLTDAKEALAKARSSHEKALVEKEIFGAIAHSDALIVTTIRANGARYDDYGNSGGFFSEHSFSGKVYPRGRVGVSFKDDGPFHPAFGLYKVDVTVQVTVPRHYQLRSNWLGNKDGSDDAYNTYTITLTLKPPYKKVETDFDMGETDFVYFERGSSGGYTAKWPNDNIYLSVKDVSVRFDSEFASNLKDLSIDYNALSQLKPSSNYEKSYIEGSYSKGMELISKFDNLDEQKINKHSSYSSNSNTASSHSSSQPSRTNTNSSKPSHSSSSYGLIGAGGLKRIVNNGDINGYASYRIECNNGNDRIVKMVNGNWSSATGSSFGDKYRNLSLDTFAKSACGR